ncbi:MAG TPA: response regulator [Chthoniobacterales bacterium]|nr:response regulator [Chthoniobacterales bacterium]
MIPAIYLLKSPLRSLPLTAARLLLLVGFAMIAGAAVARASHSLVLPSINPGAIGGLALVFAGIVSLALTCHRTPAQAFWASEPSLEWQDQFAPLEQESPSVLIADRDVFMRSALDFHLTRAGFHVEHARDAGEVASKMAKRPAVVLLDLAIPDGNKFHCLRDVRRSSPGSKIIMLSRKRDAHDISLCRKFGVYDAMAKPLDPDDVVATVTRAANDKEVNAYFALSA